MKSEPQVFTTAALYGDYSSGLCPPPGEGPSWSVCAADKLRTLGTGPATGGPDCTGGDRNTGRETHPVTSAADEDEKSRARVRWSPGLLVCGGNDTVGRTVKIASLGRT